MNSLKIFIRSAGGILLAGALIRFVMAAGHAEVLALPDPLLGIPLREAVLVAGGLELVVAIICLFGRRVGVQLGWLIWLATNFLAYRIGLLVMHCHPQATCLGSLTDPLHLARGWTGEIREMLPFFLVVGSYAALVRPWLGKRKIGQASSLPLAEKPGLRQPDYVRFLKIPCSACGGRIEFSTKFFGEQIPCPHCRAVITLQKSVNLKMSCPGCEGHLAFPDYAVGQQVPCPHCQKEITLKRAGN